MINQVNILTAKVEFLLDPKKEKEYIKHSKVFWDFSPPPLLDSSEKDFVLNIESGFETTCALLRENGYVDPKRLTTREFYATIDILEKKALNNPQNHARS